MRSLLLFIFVCLFCVCVCVCVVVVVIFFLTQQTRLGDRVSFLLFYCFSFQRPTRLTELLSDLFMFVTGYFQCVVGQINYYISFV